MLYEFILKLSAKNAWRGQFLRVSKSIWRVKCIAKSHEIEDEFYDFILTKHRTLMARAGHIPKTQAGYGTAMATGVFVDTK